MNRPQKSGAGQACVLRRTRRAAWLTACLFEPCSRLEPPALANRRGLFRRGNLLERCRRLLSVLVFRCLLFCVCFRRAKNIRLLLCPRFIPAYRRDFTCGLRRTRLFFDALLNIQKWGGAQAVARRSVVSSLRLAPDLRLTPRVVLMA